MRKCFIAYAKNKDTDQLRIRIVFTLPRQYDLIVGCSFDKCQNCGDNFLHKNGLCLVNSKTKLL